MQILLVFSLVANFLLLLWNFKLVDEKIKVESKWYKRYSQLRNQYLGDDSKQEKVKSYNKK
ncbi:MAG: hypothetical protein R6V17_00980 [Halanaerobacter sp.]